MASDENLIRKAELYGEKVSHRKGRIHLTLHLAAHMWVVFVSRRRGEYFEHQLLKAYNLGYYKNQMPCYENGSNICVAEGCFGMMCVGK